MKHLPVWAVCIVAVACSDPKSEAPLGAAAKPGGSGVVATQTELAKQDPVAAGETLIEMLVRRRQGEAIYVADSTKKPESDALAAIKADLKNRGIEFVEPVWANYQYYLNRVIPMTRREGRVWLVYDQKNEKLSDILQKGYLDQHKVLFEKRFDNATLVLVSNEFADDGAKLYSMESVVAKGGLTSNVVFSPDDDYVFVTSKEGIIRCVSRRDGAVSLVMKMPRAKQGRAGVFSGGESGLIGLALHPEFASNRLLYMHYNWRDAEGNREAIVSEWLADLTGAPATVSFGNERKLLSIKQVHDNHNAGCLKFGPDGFLYIAVGDGEDGEWTKGRSPAASMRGKVLRIDVNARDEGKQYAVPSDNPFVGNAEFPPETWAWGFRNPWRMVFVPDGRLIASDIGEDVNEELTFVVKGKHHGWPYFEGLNERNPWTLDAPLQPPLVPYARKYGMSVIAGDVYEGKDLPELVGKFVFCDYMSGRVWAFELPDTSETLDIEDLEELTRWPLLMPTITKGVDGELYFGAHTGEVLKLVRGSASAAVVAAAPAAKVEPAAARSMFGVEYVGAAGPEVSAVQVALGKRLFSDQRLSGDGSKSCATCHVLDKFGQDGVTTKAGATGPARNTPSAFNVAFQFGQFRDYRVFSVEEAVTESLTCHMGNASDESVVDRLVRDEELQAQFAAAFPGQEPSLTSASIATAVGGFLRQLKTPSRWDRFLDGDDQQLSDEELIGLGEFTLAGCTTCHMYRGLGGGMPQKLGLQIPWEGADKGHFLIDATPGQEHFFKVPNLYNVAETGPWYHDGSMKTLDQAVGNMAQIQLGRTLTDSQVKSIVLFLKALTGDQPAALR